MAITKVNPTINRWCRKCHITNKDVDFFSGKLRKHGVTKMYFFNICMPCKLEQRRRQKRAYYFRHRHGLIEAAANWNILHRDHVRRVNRNRAFKKRMSKIELNLGVSNYAQV